MHPRTAMLLSVILGSFLPGSEARIPGPARGVAVDRSESSPVLVDVIVTDKKGDYVRDLSPGEFHLWEDNREQTIRGVSRESSEPSGSKPLTHLVLFFGRIPAGDQPVAREAAAKFIEANAAPNRLMAILNYLGSGGVKVIEGFTTDSERLMLAAKNTEASGVPVSNSGTVSGVMSPIYSDPNRTGASTSFDVRSQLQALTGIAQSLASLPGRKAIAFLAPTINYGVRARTDPGSVGAGVVGSSIQAPDAPEVIYYVQPEDLAAAIDACNKAKVAIYVIDVRVDHTPEENQLGPLASATGGLAVDSSKDAFNALKKIAQDQEERYVISYLPSKSAVAGCHKVRVKVDRPGTTVRTRSEYCYADPLDPLAGTDLGKELETRAAASQPGNMAALMQSAFFYTAPDTARVHIAAEISTSDLNFVKQDGKLHAVLNVLGIASVSGSGVGARFSDKVELNFQNKKDAERFKQHPYHYENDFTVPAGQYELKLVVSPDHQNFARLEMPLVIEPWDGQHFALSGVALSRESHNISGAEHPDSFLASGHMKMISRGLEFIPTASSRYKKTDPAMLYVEVYEPLLRDPNPPKVLIQLMVVDRKSGAVKIDSGRLDMTNRVLPGNPIVPIGLKVPIEPLEPGIYMVVLKASDTAGNASVVRHAEFEVE